jgi:PAS domain S-box-containing protein
MSLGAILCVSEQPARLEELQIQLTETWADYSLSLATTELETIVCLNQLIGCGAEVPLVIVDQTLATATWVQTLWDHFPHALALVLSLDLTTPIPAAIPPAQLYRRLAQPWAAADLRFTVGEGLRRYRLEQQLAQSQAALAAAQPKSPACLTNEDIIPGGFVSEVTCLKGMELEMCCPWDLHEAVFNEATDALFLVDLDTDLIIDCNRRAQELFEADDRASLINIQGNTLRRRPLSQAELLVIRQEIAQRGLWNAEFEYQTLKGGSFWGNLAAKPIALVDAFILLVRVTDISERKRGEAERKRIEALMRQGEQNLQRTLDFAGIGTWSVHLDTEEVRFNCTMAALLELPTGIDSMGVSDFWQHWRDHIPPEDLERVNYAIATEEPFTAEYRYRMEDGRLVWRWVKGQAVYTDTGALDRLLGVTQDITPRKQAELALGQVQERYRRATQAARAGVWELNVATQVGYLDSSIKALVGYGDDEITDSLEQWLRLIHPDDRALLNDAIQTFCRRPQGEFVVEYRMLHKDGTVLWMLSRGQLQRDPQGQPELFFGTTTDITSLKQAERSLKQLNAELELRVRDRTQALQESRNMMQLVLDTIPQRVFWKDRNSRYLGCNLAFARDQLLTPNQIVGKTDNDLPFSAKARRYRAEDIQIITAQTSHLSYEELLSTPSETNIWVRTSKVPLTNADGAVIGVLGCYEDISDVKQVEASLRRLNGELEERVRDRTQALQQAVETAQSASQAKSTFLANMSHELRTPLNAILGFSQLLACDETLSPDSREAITIINRSGEHLLGLINDILEMAKIEAGQVSLKVVCFDLDVLLNTVGEMFYLRASNKGLTLKIEASPTLPRHLRADEPKLRQVLINLVGNAIKFTHQGQVTVRVAPIHPVTAPLAPDDTLMLAFTVSDTGIGIASADCDQLFEPFTQVGQGDDGLGGTGLGLTISHQFVQKLGGEITVESQIAQGTTFTVTVPVRVATGVAQAVAPPTAQVLGLAPDQPSYRILVVDDDETHRYLLTQLLQSVGFEVRNAVNGKAAIDLWQQWRPQLIWLDMRMPVLTGYEVAQYIRTHEQGNDQPPTKIIALTANAFDDDSAQAFEVGCDDFIRKPFQLNHLYAKLAEHLDVQYTYRPEAAAPPPPLAVIDAVAALRRLPPSQLLALHQATLQLDGEQLAELIAQLLPDDYPLAALLTRQLDAYAFDTLHTLFQQAQQS